MFEFRSARVKDHSAVEAIDSLATRHQLAGKRPHHLSPGCLKVREKAKDMVEINAGEDPHYHLADDKLG